MTISLYKQYSDSTFQKLKKKTYFIDLISH